MNTVTLQPDLAEQLAIVADENQVAPADIVNDAIRRYLHLYRRDKIRAETVAFEKNFSRWQSQYPEEYVAVHNGQIIDHDNDLRTLHLRVFKTLGRVPVLLKKIDQKPQREMVFRSPRFERQQQ